MDEHREGQMRRRLGMSRRDLIRRGAIVGGTLIWTVPVVKTIAGADTTGTSPFFTCCQCTSAQNANQVGSNRCGGTNLSCTTSKTSTIGSTTYRTDLESGCASYCGAQSRAYCFHRSSTMISCSNNVCGTH
jgi:hypothetical protein